MDIFFPASKLIWALIRPETWVVLAVLVIWLALGLGWLRLARRVAAVTALFLILLSVLPLGNLVLSPLERHFPAEPPLDAVDYILVLGGGERGQHAAIWGMPALNEGGERFTEAIALAYRFPQAKLVFTGGNGRFSGTGQPEAGLAREIFTSAGIDPQRLILEGRSRNTSENAAFTADLVGDLAGRWVMVTSAFHMTRAVGVFCHQGWTGITPWPVDHRSAPWGERLGWKLAENLMDLNVAVKEMIGLVAYRATGRTSSLWPTRC